MQSAILKISGGRSAGRGLGATETAEAALRKHKYSVTGEQNGGPARVGRTDRRVEPAGCGSTGEKTGRAAGSFSGGGSPGDDGWRRGGGSRRGCGGRED